MAKTEQPGSSLNSSAQTSEGSPGSRRKNSSVDNPPEFADVGKLHEPIMREKREPRDGYEPVPIWLIGVFFALIFWGGWYLAWYSGGFRRDVLDERPKFGQLGSATRDQPTDPMQLGEKIFGGRCVSCHQQNGQGVAEQYPPLVGSQWVLENPQRLKRILLHGLQGRITVQGSTYNGNMPAFAKVLDDEKIAAVLTYIRNSWGNGAEPISAESLAATRQATADRTAPWTAEELSSITQLDYTPPTPPAGGEARPDDDMEKTPTAENAPTAPQMNRAAVAEK